MPTRRTDLRPKGSFALMSEKETRFAKRVSIGLSVRERGPVDHKLHHFKVAVKGSRSSDGGLDALVRGKRTSGTGHETVVVSRTHICGGRPDRKIGAKRFFKCPPGAGCTPNASEDRVTYNRELIIEASGIGIDPVCPVESEGNAADVDIRACVGGDIPNLDRE